MQDKVVVIVGATGGIGSALTQKSCANRSPVSTGCQRCGSFNNTGK